MELFSDSERVLSCLIGLTGFPRTKELAGEAMLQEAVPQTTNPERGCKQVKR
ncbi:MAG TPA: hypothetical protein VHJ59_01415 [Nitrososphaera sp.]|nr:hypothetical protein [Nitrososphaera sp.]